ARPKTHESELRVVDGEQHPAVAGDVLQGERAWDPQDHPFLSRQIERVERTSGTFPRRGEPTSLPSRDHANPCTVMKKLEALVMSPCLSVMTARPSSPV